MMPLMQIFDPIGIVEIKDLLQENILQQNMDHFHLKLYMLHYMQLLFLNLVLFLLYMKFLSLPLNTNKVLFQKKEIRKIPTYFMVILYNLNQRL